MLGYKKLIIGSTVLLGALVVPNLLLNSNVTQVNAQFALPTFPSCVGYTGTIQAQYATGNHAIVGNPVVQSGSDIVFDLGNANYLQCFCPENIQNSTGIQTDWLGAGNLDQTTIDNLMNDGWYYIGQGQDWGLDDMPFLAKNSDYVCRANSTPTPTEPTPTPSPTTTDTPSPTPTPTVVPAVGGASSDNSQTSTPKQENVISKEVKHLAATGYFMQNLMSSIFAAGTMLLSFAAISYGKRKIA